MHTAKEKLTDLLSLLELEKVEGEKFFSKSSKSIPIKVRVQKELTIYPLKFFKKKFGLGDSPVLVLSSAGKLNSIRFQPGSSISLFCTENDEYRVKGIIDKIEGENIQIQLFSLEHPEWAESDKLGIDLLHDEYTFKIAQFCINKIISAEKNRLAELRELFYGNKKPEIKNTQKSYNNSLLNESQNNAISQALASEDVFIIHGPPGTGKTTTLTELVLELSKTENNILVTAPSNVATDLLTFRLSGKGLNVTRIGNPIRVSNELSDCTLDKKFTAHIEFKEIKKLKSKSEELYRLAGKHKRNFGKEEYQERKRLYKESRDLRKEITLLEKHLIHKTLKNSNVITCTLAGADNTFLRDFEFDTVIIDEAGQALEPFVLIPISKGNRIIMAGDPFQLPPTVKSVEANKKGLSISLMEKIMKRNSNMVAQLNVQYRMNDIIKEFSNQKFYEGQLTSHSSVKNHSLTQEDFSPLEFIDTAGCGHDEEVNSESGSILNIGEINVITKHIEQLLLSASSDTALTIAIISPYREQVGKIKEGIPNYNDYPLMKIGVHTIDSFQGQEADVIYISLVRSNADGKIGFLKDYRRMNVALTRAKKKLVVIGDSATLGNDNFFSDFLGYVENLNSYRSAWEFM